VFLYKWLSSSCRLSFPGKFAGLTRRGAKHQKIVREETGCHVFLYKWLSSSCGLSFPGKSAGLTRGEPYTKRLSERRQVAIGVFEGFLVGKIHNLLLIWCFFNFFSWDKKNLA
jgi:hypothetical protein